ncbi:NlpC/P60 family protein [Streptomyces camelliae]|uniref:NlpC/P60 family protein n=1 Tax=Streptomyces camelliae TaxID=3004093 RepID=A0ABY7NX83_9ACTN|nr:NlpC/P60 family protein [Streptomyces sp. HUAS 2-6]WBO62147.1 NlpC/P60 family protein [Streptomyces sp. HUAS 2-6]
MAPGAQGTATLMAPGAQGAAALMAPGTLEASALTTPGAQGTPLGGGTAETAARPVTEPPATPGSPVREPGSLPGAAVPGRPSPATSKAYNQRKLAAASDQLTRHTTRLAAPTTALQSTPVTAAQPDAGQAGQTTGQWQQSQWAAPDGSAAAAAPQAPAGTNWPDAAASPITTGSFPSPAIPAPTATDTGSIPYPANPTGSFPSLAIPAPTTADTGSVPVAYPGGTALTATGSFQAPGTPASPLDTGSFQTLGPASPVGTGVLPPLGAPTPTPDPLTTGGFVAQTAPAPSPSPSPAPETSPVTRAAKAIAFARAQIGKPCVWGATGPDSYDCSSLTQAAWRAAGVTVPRAAHEQAFAGAPVTPEGIEPGDLVLFFDDDRHVGLHVGGGMMVHAPGPGSTIREESIYGAGESAIHRIVRPA